MDNNYGNNQYNNNGYNNGYNNNGYGGGYQSNNQYGNYNSNYNMPRDERKGGGRFEAVRGRIRRINEAEGLIVMEDGRSVRLGDVCAVEGEIFEDAGI